MVRPRADPTLPDPRTGCRVSTCQTVPVFVLVRSVEDWGSDFEKFDMSTGEYRYLLTNIPTILDVHEFRESRKRINKYKFIEGLVLTA